MSVRVWLPMGAVTILLGVLVWTSRGSLLTHPAPRSAQVDSPAPDIPAVATPPTPNCSMPLSLDAKVTLHLVPLPDSRTGCRVELRTKENPFAGGEVLDGDVITEVGQEPMSARVALGLAHRLEQAGDTGIALTVLRNGETRRVVARVAR